MDMNTPIIQIEKLSHRYAIQWAIRDINIRIDGRGIYGLLGSNGAGKSTLMNIMCGVLRQTEGSVKLNGIDTRIDPVEAKCQVGFLPQQPPLQLDLTVEEYLRYAAKLRYIPIKEQTTAVNEVLEKCSISHFRKRLLRNLSGGYQQRVGIAQAIIHKPEVIVLDEPTNGLDPNQIVEIRSLIKELAQEHTIILSTHILPEVQAACEYIYMMEQGKMVFAGTVDEFDNYILPTMIRVVLLSNPNVEELKKIPGLLSVESLGNNEFRLQFSDVQGMVEQVIEISSINGWRLCQIYVEKNSLDRVFAELSHK